MNDDDREFVREMMKESKNGPPLMRPIDWIVGKTFWMSDAAFSAFLAAFNALGVLAFASLGWVVGYIVYRALCG